MFLLSSVVKYWNKYFPYLNGHKGLVCINTCIYTQRNIYKCKEMYVYKWIQTDAHGKLIIDRAFSFFARQDQPMDQHQIISHFRHNRGILYALPSPACHAPSSENLLDPRGCAHAIGPIWPYGFVKKRVWTGELTINWQCVCWKSWKSWDFEVIDLQTKPDMP